MKYGEILSSIEVLSLSLMDAEKIKSKTIRKGVLIGIRSLCELLNRDFDRYWHIMNTEQERKLDEDLESLFLMLKKIENETDERK